MTTAVRTAKRPMKHLPAQLTLDHVSPATLLLEKRRQMLEVQQALDAQKEEYARKEEAFKRREDTLRKKDLELQESLVQFNKFLKDKYDKRAKYDRMAQEERKQRQLKEKEISSRKATLETLTKECRELKKQVRNHEQYQAFLSRLQEENLSEWPEVESVLSRYQALDFAYQDLLQRQNETIRQNEKFRNEFANYTKEQITSNLNLNNRLAQLQSSLERAESATAARENEVDKKMQLQASRSRELSEIIMAVENLYQRCTRQSSILNHSEHLKHKKANSHAKVNNGEESEKLEENDEKHDESESLMAIRSKIEETETRLDAIANYVIDYDSIADEGIKTNGRVKASLKQ